VNSIKWKKRSTNVACNRQWERAIAFPPTTTHRVNTSTTTTIQTPLARVATKVVVVAPQASLYRIENSLLSKCHLTFIFCSWPNCISSNWVIRGWLKTRELLAKRTLQPISGRMSASVCVCVGVAVGTHWLHICLHAIKASGGHSMFTNAIIRGSQERSIAGLGQNRKQRPN